MVFYWSLSDSKSPQVTRTLFSILAVLDNIVVWMVSTRPPTSKSSSPFNNPLVTVPNAPITIGIIVTCMFHSFFNSLARLKYLPSFHILSVLFAGTAKSTTLQVLFLCCWLLSGRVFRPRLGDPCLCQNPIIRVFHAKTTWWSFTGFSVATSLLKSRELFLVFWLILIRL